MGNAVCEGSYHSLPSSAKDKCIWIFRSIPPMFSHYDRHKGNFLFTITFYKPQLVKCGIICIPTLCHNILQLLAASIGLRIQEAPHANENSTPLYHLSLFQWNDKTVDIYTCHTVMTDIYNFLIWLCNICIFLPTIISDKMSGMQWKTAGPLFNSHMDISNMMTHHQSYINFYKNQLIRNTRFTRIGRPEN